jgi:catechol 2,3-dioxygenase-like lactoylglutathione lyase family enzyme
MMHLRLPMIFAKDMERMTAFYRDGIGLELVAERSSDWWVEFQAGAAMLALHQVSPDIADCIEITTPPEPRSNTPIKLGFETADLEATRAHLIEHGAIMFEPRRWGTCDGLDPEGNVFQIVRV